MRVGLDIDGPLAMFQEHLLRYYNLDPTPPTRWDDPRFTKCVPIAYKDPNFWLSIPPACDPKTWIFKPVGYVTARGIDPKLTKAWLIYYGFPEAEVITVGHNGSKVEALRTLKTDIYLDDSFANYQELIEANIRCVLYTQSHNEQFFVPDRVSSMDEFQERYVKQLVCI